MKLKTKIVICKMLVVLTLCVVAAFFVRSFFCKEFNDASVFIHGGVMVSFLLVPLEIWAKKLEKEVL